MTFKEFWAKLTSINPKLRILKLDGPVWGIHIHQPRHEYANELGWLHICSMPSPHWYGQTLTPTDKVDKHGQYVRGWRMVLRLLVDKHYISNAKTRAAFGYRWRWDS